MKFCQFLIWKKISRLYCIFSIECNANPLNVALEYRDKYKRQAQRLTSKNHSRFLAARHMANVTSTRAFYSQPARRLAAIIRVHRHHHRRRLRRRHRHCRRFASATDRGTGSVTRGSQPRKTEPATEGRIQEGSSTCERRLSSTVSSLPAAARAFTHNFLSARAICSNPPRAIAGAICRRH